MTSRYSHSAGRVLAIDPGVHQCACAVFVGGLLVHVSFAKHGDAIPVSELKPFTEVVVERPQQDGRSHGARPKDLIDLAWEGAKLAAAFAGHSNAQLVERTPRQWKGSEPKPVHHSRLWALLNSRERSVLGGETTQCAIYAACEKGALNRWGRPGASYYPRAWVTHNLLDAAALGATYLGRLRRTNG